MSIQDVLPTVLGTLYMGGERPEEAARIAASLCVSSRDLRRIVMGSCWRFVRGGEPFRGDLRDSISRSRRWVPWGSSDILFEPEVGLLRLGDFCDARERGALPMVGLASVRMSTYHLGLPPKHPEHVGHIELDLDDEYESIDGLAAFVALRRLELGYFHKPPELSVLSNLSDLRALDLNMCRCVESLSGLERLSLLTHLALPHVMGGSASMEVVGSLVGLQTLMLYGYGRDWKAHLEGLTTLRVLEVPRSQVLAHPDELPGIASLEVLELFFCPNLESLKGLGTSMPNLRELRTRYCGVSSLEHTGGLPHLTRLDAVGCPRLASMRGASDMRGLRSISAHTCSSLVSLEGISALEMLKDLEAGGESLSDVSAVDGLSGLRRLSLLGCKTLERVDGISGASGLAELRLEAPSLREGSLDGLRDLPLLRSLDIDTRGAAPIRSDVRRVPDLGGMTGLTRLVARVAHAGFDLSGVEDLAGLVELEVSGGRLEIPDGWGDRPLALTRLSLSSNVPVSPPTFSGGFGMLRSLSVSGFASSTYLAEAACLTALTRLRLGEDCVPGPDAPPEVCGMPGLLLETPYADSAKRRALFGRGDLVFRSGMASLTVGS